MMFKGGKHLVHRCFFFYGFFWFIIKIILINLTEDDGNGRATNR